MEPVIKQSRVRTFVSDPVFILTLVWMVFFCTGYSLGECSGFVLDVSEIPVPSVFLLLIRTSFPILVIYFCGLTGKKGILLGILAIHSIGFGFCSGVIASWFSHGAFAVLLLLLGSNIFRSIILLHCCIQFLSKDGIRKNQLFSFLFYSTVVVLLDHAWVAPFLSDCSHFF